ncbi:MAG TPA: GAF domain-containing protein [Anaerolineales bacterium]|nr:GAF domain-containing protein [Anaerolineales bacterium]
MSHIRILLVEDNPDDRLLIKRGIRKGMDSPTILEVHREELLAKAIQSGEFDIVITDFNLGWTNGIEVLKSVKDYWPGCPVIMMTVMDTEEVAINAMKAGLDNYIVKSASQFALMGDTIRAALKKKESEQALEDAEIRYQELSDSVPIGLFRESQGGTQLSVNQTLVNMLEYPDKETLLAVNSKDLYLTSTIRQDNYSKLAQGTLAAWEAELLKFDGSPLNVLVTAHAIYDKNQKLAYYEGYIQDISERKRVEDALRQSEILNETIVASVHDGVLVTDRDLNIVVWNNYLEELTGLQFNQVLGQSAVELLSQSTSENIEEALRKALSGETVFSPDTTFQFSATGKEGWIEISYAPLRKRSGEVVGVVANIHNITQRKENETEKERLLAAERKRSRELTALTTAATTISSNLDIAHVLKVVAEQMIQLLNIDSCAISTWENGSDTITKLAEHRALSDTPIPSHTMPKNIFNQIEIRTVLESATPLQVNHSDKNLSPALKKEMKENDIRSLLMIPLIYQERTIGLIELEDHQTQRLFNEQEVFLAQMLGNQAAVALENAHLFNQVANNLTREQKLHESTRQISKSLDLNSIIHSTNSLLSDMFDGAMTAVMLIDPKTKEFQKVEYFNMPENAPTGKFGEKGLMWEALQQEKSLCINDYPNFVNPNPAWVEFGLQCGMATPIESTDMILGVVGIFSNNPDKQFTQRDQELAISITRQAGVALHKAILYKDSVRHTQELSALYDFSLTTGSVLDTTTLLQYLYNKIHELISPDATSIYTYHDEPKAIEITMAYIKNKPAFDLIGKLNPVEPGDLISELILNRKPISIPQMVNSSGEKLMDQSNPDSKSWLGIPLAKGEQILGALVVESEEANAFSIEDQRFLESIAAQVSIALDNTRLYEELEDAYVQTVIALANAVDVRDTYTHDHSQRIAVLSNETGVELGMDEKELELLRWGSLLHDIGKIGVPDHILLKPSALTDEEYEIIKKHPGLGASIVAPVKKLREVAPIIRAHQEHYDGKGYPDGLVGEDIPLAARVLTVVDAYVAMTDDRVYRKAHSHEYAINEIKSLSGAQFSPDVVDAFLRVMKRRNSIPGLEDL